MLDNEEKRERTEENEENERMNKKKRNRWMERIKKRDEDNSDQTTRIHNEGANSGYCSILQSKKCRTHHPNS